MELIKSVARVSNFNRLCLLVTRSFYGNLNVCIFLASQRGNVGVVHYATNEEELNWLINVGPDAPYVVLLRPDLFRRYRYAILKNSDIISRKAYI